MSIKKRAVRVHQVPAHLTAAQEREFLSDLSLHADTERPRFVLDCSQLDRLDQRTAHLLLCSLEEVMKRNGDVRLAAFPATVEADLQASGIGRLFEFFATPELAIQSFHLRATSLAPFSIQNSITPGKAEHAA